MPAGTDRRTAVIAAWIVSIGLGVSGIVLTIVAWSDLDGVDASTNVIAGISAALYATLGVLVLRRTRNVIGWMLLGEGAGMAVLCFGSAYGVVGIVTSPGTLPGAKAVGAIAEWSFVPVASGLAFMFLVFPTGSLPSRRWRPIATVGVAASAFSLIALVVTPREIALPAPGGYSLTYPNPFGIEALGSKVPLGTLNAYAFLLVVLLALGFAALIVRYRSGDLETRQQLKWVALVAAGALAASIVGGAAQALCRCQETPVSFVAYLVIPLLLLLGIPAAITVAILKYRLYDIDVVINKTVVYGLLGRVHHRRLRGDRGRGRLGPSGRTGERAAVHRGHRGDRRGLPAGPGAGPAARQPPRVREAGHPLRGALGLRRADGRDRAPPRTLLPRMARVLGRGDRGAAATRLAPGRRRAPAARASLADARRHEVATLPLVPATSSRDIARDATSSVPVRHRGELLGALSLVKPPGEPLTPTERTLAEDLAAQAGLVLRNVRSPPSWWPTRGASGLPAAPRDAPRTRSGGRLERNIHDGAQQQLVAMAVQLGLAERLVDQRRREGEASCSRDAPGRRPRRRSTNLRDLARGIYPPLLADQGLAAALERPGPQGAVPGRGRRRRRRAAIPRRSRRPCTSACLEASRTRRSTPTPHASTSGFRTRTAALSFEVADDGEGFDPASRPLGSGLTNMRDRLDALGGSLDVRSAPGSGTTVAGRIPLDGQPSTR